MNLILRVREKFSLFQETLHKTSVYCKLEQSPVAILSTDLFEVPKITAKDRLSAQEEQARCISFSLSSMTRRRENLVRSGIEPTQMR